MVEGWLERVVCARTLLPLTRTLLPLAWCLEPGASSLGGNPRPGLLSHLSPFQTFTFTCQGQDGQRPFCSPLDKLWGLPMLKVCYVGQEYFQSIEKFTVPPFSFTLNKLNSLSYYLLLSRS